IEVQIRTREMHEHAEYGIAAHWRYKEGKTGGNRNEDFDSRIEYIRRLMEMGLDGNEDAKEFLEHMKSQVFEDRVYAVSPKGDIIDLPVGATPIDFAYHIHTEIGHRCRGAKVNGRLVNLSYQLKTGERIDIVTAKRGGPSLDWLNTDSGFVKTNRARSKIRQWFRKQNRDSNITSGRSLLDQEMKKLGVTDAMTFEHVAGLFDYDSTEDFFASIGAGDINAAQIDGRILDETQKLERQKSRNTLAPRKAKGAMQITAQTGVDGVRVMGAGGFLVNLARCCAPVVGDEIVGFVTRGRGITVHRTDCPNVTTTVEPERLIEVAWSGTGETHCYPVEVEIVAYDREGLMADISIAIAEEKINMSTVNVYTRQDIATFQVTMQLKHIQQLTKVLTKVSGIPSGVEARRKNASSVFLRA
ncbi:MAG: TGS domain-containing protein, partial [Chloroflexota bacterium]